MRISIVIVVIMAVAGTGLAQELGKYREPPAKTTTAEAHVSPGELKQGGDTMADATVLSGLPYYDTGTTAGYAHDYDEVCPYGSSSPDVVYSFTPVADIAIDVDLCGSSYDTKTYIYDPDMNLMACNDDYYFGDDPCGQYVSKVENVGLTAGITYYIVVDGYGNYFGDYVLSVTEYEECFVTCPADAVLEGEPALHDGYDDHYNAGCGAYPPVFQYIDWTNDEDGVPPYDGQAWLCAKSGWFLSADGFDTRDTDWFIVHALETGQMEVTVESEHPCLLIKLDPPDCNTVAPELNVPTDCEESGTLVFPVTADQEIWLWVGPVDFTGPVTEFTYFMTVSNNLFDVVPADELSFGAVKALYR